MLIPYDQIANTELGLVVMYFDMETTDIRLHGVSKLPRIILTSKEANDDPVRAVANELLATTIHVPGVEIIICQVVVDYDPRYELMLYPHYYLTAQSVLTTDDENWPVIGLLQRRLGTIIAPKEVSSKLSMFPDIAKSLTPLRELHRNMVAKYPRCSNLPTLTKAPK